MFQRKGELVKKCNPLYVSTVHFLLSNNVFQCFMIKTNNKFSLDQVVSPMLSSLDNDIEFDIISRIPKSRPIKLLTEIGNGSIILTQHNTNPHMWYICLNLKIYYQNLVRPKSLGSSHLPPKSKDFAWCNPLLVSS